MASLYYIVYQGKEINTYVLHTELVSEENRKAMTWVPP